MKTPKKGDRVYLKANQGDSRPYEIESYMDNKYHLECLAPPYHSMFVEPEAIDWIRFENPDIYSNPELAEKYLNDIKQQFDEINKAITENSLNPKKKKSKFQERLDSYPPEVKKWMESEEEAKVNTTEMYIIAFVKKDGAITETEVVYAMDYEVIDGFMTIREGDFNTSYYNMYKYDEVHVSINPDYKPE